MSCELCYFEHNDKYCKEQDKNEPKKYTDAVVKGGHKHEDRLYLDNTLSVIIGQLALNASYLQRILKLLCEDRDIIYHEIEIECQEHGIDLVNAIICDIKRKGE